LIYLKLFQDIYSCLLDSDVKNEEIAID